MAEVSLYIPEEEIVSLRHLVSRGTEPLADLADALETAQPYIRWQDMIPEIVPKVGKDSEWTSKALATVWRLNIVRSRLDVASGEFVRQVSGFLSQADPETWTETDKENWGNALSLIHRLVDPHTAFGIAVKATELMTEQAVFVRSVRIITDMRAVFDEDATEIEGVSLFHTLVLECQENDHPRDIHVAFDDGDLEMLQSQIDRARRKAQLLRSTCSSASVKFIPVASGPTIEGGEENGCSPSHS